MIRILAIDDDERLCRVLAEYLGEFTMDVTCHYTPSAGLAALQSGDFDLVLLDVMLPEKDGFAVCREIRATSTIPVIMLTARGEVTDRIVGLEIGADDYLPKPFEPRELVARIQNILRRTNGSEERSNDPNRIERGDLVIDKRRQEVLRGGQPLPMTAMEVDLLSLLAARPGEYFSRDDIMREIHGIDADVISRAVDILVSRVRRKLKPGDYILTARGKGYSFVDPAV
ncbi:response regulator transcription factor [Gammaproteobacteria bacterium]|nr:response regulator transcription factor [Gammaproteobacteria bacterium]